MADHTIMDFKDVSFEAEQGLVKKKRVNIILNISFNIKRGEILSIVGESGCGKTTIGKLASDLLQPTSGQILFHGKDIRQLNRNEYKKMYRPKVQMVQQDSYASLNPTQNVYNILGIPLKYYGTKDGELKEKVSWLLKYVGVNPPEYFMNKFPYHLSGGQRQRICFARAIIPNPEVVVADEPVSMIDMSLRLAMLDMIIKLNEERNISFFYITHDLPTVKYLGEKVNMGNMMVMYLGEIVEYCSIKEAFSNPKHPYLQALLRAAPVPDPIIAKKMTVPVVKATEIPSISNRPSGCPFHPRCVYEQNICSKEKPELRDIDEGHKVRCHLVERIPKWEIL